MICVGGRGSASRVLERPAGPARHAGKHEHMLARHTHTGICWRLLPGMCRRHTRNCAAGPGWLGWAAVRKPSCGQCCRCVWSMQYSVHWVLEQQLGAQQALLRFLPMPLHTTLCSMQGPLCWCFSLGCAQRLAAGQLSRASASVQQPTCAGPFGLLACSSKMVPMQWLRARVAGAAAAAARGSSMSASQQAQPFQCPGMQQLWRMRRTSCFLQRRLQP